MKHKILFVERKSSEYVSIENAFRKIATNLPGEFETEFQQVPYGNRFFDTLRNLFFFRKKTADIYHITGHIHYMTMLFARRNTVLSIMDVRFLYAKRGLRRWLLKKLYLDWPVNRLDFITAISEEIKTEIVRHTGCDEQKIRVLDLPLFIEIESEKPAPSDHRKPIILQVGTMKNKNIPTLAKAIRDIDCKLRIIGRLDAVQASMLEENKIEFENAYELSDEQMRNEYRSADLVAFCSTHEGFGLPIIEAQ